MCLEDIPSSVRNASWLVKTCLVEFHKDSSHFYCFMFPISSCIRSHGFPYVLKTTDFT